MLQRYLDFAKIVSQQYKDIASVVDITIERLRLKVKDGSLIDIRFPVIEKFSFHWMRGAKLFRVDTTPHHPNVKTAPRHIHYEREDDIREDFIPGNIDDPVERFRSFLKWVRKMM
jgi:hypothetical protein